MVSNPKKSPKIVELCLKLVKFLFFTQKIQKKIGFCSSEKFCMELDTCHMSHVICQIYMGRFCMTVKWPNPGLFNSDFGRSL